LVPRAITTASTSTSTALAVPTTSTPVVESAAAFFTWASQVDFQITVVPIEFVEHANGVFSLNLGFHFHERKAPRASGVTIHDQSNGCDLSRL
jgi:hypothetical protein